MQMTVAESQKLYDCAKRLPEGAVVVEVGTWEGGSAMLLGAAVEEKGGTVFTIDNFRTDVFPGGRKPEEVTRNNLVNSKNVTLLVGNSEEIAASWDKPIDMLFIDGDHVYASVHEDIKNWVSKVKDGGIVCFHDYGSYTDVTIAVNEALMKRISFPDHSLLAIIK